MVADIRKCESVSASVKCKSVKKGFILKAKACLKNYGSEICFNSYICAQFFGKVWSCASNINNVKTM